VSSESESPANVVVSKGSGWVKCEGLFAQGQHVIFGSAQDGGPDGVGSGRNRGPGEGERGILSWRRDLVERDERAGTMRKPSSWDGDGLRRKSGNPAGVMWMSGEILRTRPTGDGGAATGKFGRCGSSSSKMYLSIFTTIEKNACQRR
jgi:hypothetical protein